MIKKSTLVVLAVNLLFLGNAFASDASQELVKNIPESSKHKVTQICEYCGEPIDKCKCKDKRSQHKKIVSLSVTKKGFEPSQIKLKPGTTAVLHITRKTNATCAKEISIPSLKLKEKLPLNKMVSIDLGKLEKGEIRFGCGMGLMISGNISVK